MSPMDSDSAPLFTSKRIPALQAWSAYSAYVRSCLDQRRDLGIHSCRATVTPWTFSYQARPAAWQLLQVGLGNAEEARRGLAL